MLYSINCFTIVTFDLSWLGVTYVCPMANLSFWFCYFTSVFKRNWYQFVRAIQYQYRHNVKHSHEICTKTDVQSMITLYIYRTQTRKTSSPLFPWPTKRWGLHNVPLFTSVGSWWRHQMETFSALLALCGGNSTVPSEFPAQRPVTQSVDVFFDLRLIKRLSKHSRCWWFETLSRPLWRLCNGAGQCSAADSVSCTSSSQPSNCQQCLYLD